RLCEAELKTLEARLDPRHETTLLARFLLADTYTNLGRLDEAAALYERTIPEFEATVGLDHRYIPGARYSLGRCYMLRGEYAKADPLLRNALELWRKKLGPDQPVTGNNALNMFAENLQYQGRWAEAESVAREVLASRERTQPDHWRTFDARSRLGGVLLGQKKY